MKRKAGKKPDRSRSMQRPPTRARQRSDRPRPAAAGSKILEHLAPEHGMAALRVFAERHQELVPEIEQIVRDLTASTTVKTVADHVVAALAELTMFDLARRDPGDPLGYRDETETAWDVVTETIQPFVDAVGRLAKMGLTAAALIQCEGVLLGLYRADREDVSELLEWAPDAMSELAVEPLRALAPVRQKAVPDTGLTAGRALKEFAREHLPEWKWLQK